MAIFIFEETHYRDETIYTVNFFYNCLTVSVTGSANVAADWLRTTLSHHQNIRHLVVGVGVQWNPRYDGYIPAHTLQLCIGARCLIFQLALADSVPDVLRNFLLDTDHTFVGLWSGSDARRLIRSRHRVEIREILDLRNFVRARDGRSLFWASVEEIVRECLGFQGVRVNRAVSMSNWDAEFLSYAQVIQATAVAYVSFLIGRNYRV